MHSLLLGLSTGLRTLETLTQIGRQRIRRSLLEDSEAFAQCTLQVLRVGFDAMGLTRSQCRIEFIQARFDACHPSGTSGVGRRRSGHAQSDAQP